MQKEIGQSILVNMNKIYPHYSFTRLFLVHFTRCAISEKISFPFPSVVSFFHGLKKIYEAKSGHTDFLAGMMMVCVIYKAVYKETPYSFTDFILMITFRGPI